MLLSYFFVYNGIWEECLLTLVEYLNATVDSCLLQLKQMYKFPPLWEAILIFMYFIRNFLIIYLLIFIMILVAENSLLLL